jgi:hypothetical protein
VDGRWYVVLNKSYTRHHPIRTKEAKPGQAVYNLEILSGTKFFWRVLMWRMFGKSIIKDRDEINRGRHQAR